MKIIYLIRATSRFGELTYKIGITGRTTVLKRLKEHQTSNPDTLEILYQFNTKIGEQVERAVQNYYIPGKVRGEWFDIDFLKIDEFLGVCERTETNIALMLAENTYYQKQRGLL